MSKRKEAPELIEEETDDKLDTSSGLPPRHYDTEPDHLAEQNQAADSLNEQKIQAAERIQELPVVYIEFTD